jgi:hypothetical protein
MLDPSVECDCSSATKRRVSLRGWRISADNGAGEEALLTSLTNGSGRALES